MVLLWKLFTGESVPRISGLEHVKRLLEHPSVQEPGAVLWVVATETSREKLVEFLARSSEAGGQTSEVRGRRSEVRGSKAEVGGRKSEARNPRPMSL